jgi:hypothetical protein
VAEPESRLRNMSTAYTYTSGATTEPVGIGGRQRFCRTASSTALRESLSEPKTIAGREQGCQGAGASTALRCPRVARGWRPLKQKVAAVTTASRGSSGLHAGVRSASSAIRISQSEVCRANSAARAARICDFPARLSTTSRDEDGESVAPEAQKRHRRPSTRTSAPVQEDVDPRVEPAGGDFFEALQSENDCTL